MVKKKQYYVRFCLVPFLTLASIFMISNIGSSNDVGIISDERYSDLLNSSFNGYKDPQDYIITNEKGHEKYRETKETIGKTTRT